MFKAIILAAGKGTRMNTDIPKVLNKINEKCLVQYVIDEVKNIGVQETITIVGYKAEEVKATIKDNKIIYAEQKELLGTGHAVMQAEQYIEDNDTVIILYGDAPLIKGQTLKTLKDEHDRNGNAVTILTTILDDAANYGRIIRNESNKVIGIVEKKDANEEQIAIKEINSGVYCFNGKKLKEALKNIDNNNSQKEYYLTDTIKILVAQGFKIGSYISQDHTEVLGVNTVEELNVAAGVIADRN